MKSKELEEQDVQKKIVLAIDAQKHDIPDIVAQADKVLKQQGYRFTDTPTTVFSYSLAPMVTSEDRHISYAGIDKQTDIAAWGLVANLTPTEKEILFGGFRPAERLMVERDIEERIKRGLNYRMFRRIDRLGGEYNFLLGTTLDRQVIEENSNSPDGGNYQYAHSLAFNTIILPLLREWVGIDLPNLPVMWDNLWEEMQHAAQVYERSIRTIAILYLEDQRHIAKDVEMPALANFFRQKGIATDYITQNTIVPGQLNKYDVVYKAFDSSRKLTDDGLKFLTQEAGRVPMVGRPSEVVFGAKTLMGLLSKAARSKDPRLTPDQRDAINSSYHWKDVIHPVYSPTVLAHTGEELYWKDFILKYGNEVYLKENIGGSGYAVLRIGGGQINSPQELIMATERACEHSALEIEGMVKTPTRPFSLIEEGKYYKVAGASDYTEYWVGGNPTRTGFGRFTIPQDDKGDNPRILKNITQGAKFSPLLVI